MGGTVSKRPARAARECKARRGDDAIHRRIAAEGAELRRRVAAGMGPSQPAEFPAVSALYQEAVAHVRRSPRLPKTIAYRGKAYRLEVTNLGRVKVLDRTGLVIVAGGPGAAW